MKSGTLVLVILAAVCLFCALKFEGAKARKVAKSARSKHKLKVAKAASSKHKLKVRKAASSKTNKLKVSKAASSKTKLKKAKSSKKKGALKEAMAGGDGGWQLSTPSGKSLTDILDAQGKLLDQLRDELVATLKLQGLAKKIHKKTREIRKKVTKVTGKVTSLTEKVDEGTWPKGEYCILSKGGKCPEGFSVAGGQMSSVSLYGGSSSYITPGTFGDSWISCRFGCCGCGNWIGELRILACCK